MRQKKRSKIWSIGIALCLLGGITSCDDTKIYDQSFPCDGEVWDSEDIKTFTFDVTDTISPVNIFVNLRTTVDYPYSNMYVFMYSEYPGGVTEKDTLDFILAAPDGKWYGENSGTVVSFKGLIASGGRFGEKGTYTFKLEHAMEDLKLPEVIDVGMRVETMVVES